MGRPAANRFPAARRAGQSVVLLLALLVAMAAMAFWMLDIRGYVLGRLRAQDGGDAAALAAARWQAAGLNLCGELNLIQAYMLADDVANAGAAVGLHRLRERVQRVAPMLALLSAQAAAEANGLPPLEPQAEVREYLLDAARFAVFDGHGDPEQASADFREMMAVVCANPVRAVPMTPVVVESPSLLANQDFYVAVLESEWCWFWFNAYSFMQSFRGRADFGPAPEIDTQPFFGLRLAARFASVDRLGEEGRLAPMDAALGELGHPPLPEVPPEEGSPARVERGLSVPWTVYDASRWGAWTLLDELPMEGPVEACFDYAGASAAVGVAREGASWVAAAKAFGRLEGENPTAAELALGGFGEVRLIPVDAADAGIAGFDLAWLRHLRFHLHDYVASGTLQGGCRYCRALRRWEDPAFRRQGLEWLRLHGSTCRRPRPGGPSPRGGARFAH